jgi:hypothetical protein
VQLRLANPSRPTTADEAVIFIEQYILPTLEGCKELHSHDKIIAGGPVAIRERLATQVRAGGGAMQ